jgi:chemotaxis protein CheX
MAISESDVRQLTTEIWRGMLQIELAPSEVASRRGAGIGACVQITGAWEGAVRVDCSLNLARLATSRFLATEPEQVGIDQIRDAIGELANMSAGIVKPLLPKPCQLSLPSVADGSDYTLTVPQGAVGSGNWIRVSRGSVEGGDFATQNTLTTNNPSTTNRFRAVGLSLFGSEDFSFELST